MLQLIRILTEYVSDFNQARSHTRLVLRTPEPMVSLPVSSKAEKVFAFRVLNGLHHDYR